MKDLAGDPAHADRIRQLGKRLAKLQIEMDDRVALEF